jgi:hypothetical protein
LSLDSIEQKNDLENIQNFDSRKIINLQKLKMMYIDLENYLKKIVHLQENKNLNFMKNSEKLQKVLILQTELKTDMIQKLISINETGNENMTQIKIKFLEKIQNLKEFLEIMMKFFIQTQEQLTISKQINFSKMAQFQIQKLMIKK